MILQLLTLIPIAGGIIGFLAIVFGLGVLLLTLLRARSLNVLQVLLHRAGL